MKSYPLKLKYATSTAIWGGSELSKNWGKVSDILPIAETWELTAREGKMSYIENGELAGLSLAEAINALKSTSVSQEYDSGHFPLLIKFIDAASELSVQVHPDDDYASSKKDLGKTEMWYILEAKEGACLTLGLKPGTTKDELAEAVSFGETDRVLRRVEVHAGESYFIPSGLVHAIGGGILLAEIQQNSDLTYRLYDHGRGRELHIKDALACVKNYTDDEIAGLCFTRGGKDDPECLAKCEYFSVYKIQLDGVRELCADESSFHSLLCTAGEAEIYYGGEKYNINRGDCFFLPAGLGKYEICGKADIIISTL